MPPFDLEKLFADPGGFLNSPADASALKALLGSVMSLKSLWDNFPLGILVADAGGRVLYYNQALSEIDGLKRDFVLGKRLTEVYDPLPEPMLTESCLIARRSVSNYICVYRTCQGKMVNSSHWIYPLEMEGVLVGALCLVQEYQPIRSYALPEAASGEPGAKPGHRPTLDSLVGHNRLLVTAVKTAKAAADTEAHVLLSGETGVGKDVFARGIHQASPRAARPFVAVNCSAIPASLIEALLFGTAPGAFTGALDRAGLFERAGGGTLFLDEIDSLPRTLQPRLLRVLEDRTVRRVGEGRERPTDVRIISSIGCHPNDLLDGRKMRPDLFYRLAAAVVVIPPLRLRLDDLDELCHHFIRKFNLSLGRRINALAWDTRWLFTRYDWPGNIRELEHVIEGAMHLAGEEEVLTADLLPAHFVESAGPLPRPRPTAMMKSPPARVGAAPKALSAEVLLDRERQLIEKALIESRGQLRPAAELLGVSRQVLSYKLKKMGLDRVAYQPKDN